MVSEGAGKNYLSSGSDGQFNVPDKLSLDDFSHNHSSTDSTTPASTAAEQTDDQLRNGIYTKADKTPETTLAAAAPAGEVDVANQKPELKLDLAERLDPTKPMALLKLFGDLIITHESTTQMPDTRIDNVAKGKPELDASEEDHSDTYNGNAKTQEAVASVAKVLPRDSEIPDQLLQTLDRLNRKLA